MYTERYFMMKSNGLSSESYNSKLCFEGTEPEQSEHLINDSDMCDRDKQRRVQGDETREREAASCGGVGPWLGVWLDGRPCNRLFSNVQLLIIPGVINHPSLTNELQQSGTPHQIHRQTHIPQPLCQWNAPNPYHRIVQ